MARIDSVSVVDRRRSAFIGGFLFSNRLGWERSVYCMKKILLIEDDADLFSLLKYNLEKEGFSMTGLQTGRGALDLCRQVRPDLILLDIMLPDSDGLDLCKGIRKDPDLASTPVIFLT